MKLSQCLLPAALLGVICLASSTSIVAQEAKGPAQPNDKSLGAKAPEGGVYLFQDSLDAWTKRDGKSPADWRVEKGVFTVAPKKGDIKTREEFGDFQLHVEFNIPYMPDAKGQARGNSGVYLQGIYELQVLDSYGLKLQDNDCGAIYKQVVPAVNACKPPLQWQSYDITFHAAKRKGDKVTDKARLTVVQNGLKIIDNREISPTPGGLGEDREGKDGPILLQDHGNEVQFRNIWIKRLP